MPTSPRRTPHIRTIPRSPESQERRIIDIDIEKKELEIQKEAERWTCCSGTMNRHLLKYTVQVGISSSVLLFSIYQIVSGADNQEIYFSLISGILGSFAPQPKLPEDI